jgi:hypothetical protein
VITFLNERYDFQYNSSRNNPKNSMQVYGWKIHGMEDDLLFFFVQRKCHHPITRLNIIRTAGIQISTPAGINGLNKYHEDKMAVTYIPKNNTDVMDDIDFDATTPDLPDED